MNTQNVTLSIRKDLLRKAKILAVQRNTSLSGLLSQALEEMVSQEEAYQAASLRHKQLMKDALDLGSQGEIYSTRDDLHER